MIKNFKGIKIIIRKLAEKDIKQAKKFQQYLNALIAEDAKILMKTKKTARESKQWIKGKIKETKQKKRIYLVAEDEKSKKIAGLSSLKLGIERQDHLAVLSINIGKDYRRLGLGAYLIKEVIKLAKKDLEPRPKIIKLKVFENNQPAMKLYQKMGFKKAARVREQIQYKGKLIAEFIMLLYL